MAKRPGIGRKVAEVEPESLDVRLTMRMTQEDFRKLCELRDALHLDGDGQTVRALVRLCYASRRSMLQEFKLLEGDRQ
jgi:hypothetical protein